MTASRFSSRTRWQRGMVAALTALLGLLFAASVSANGYGNRHHGYGHGGANLILSYGRHSGHGRSGRYHGGYRHGGYRHGGYRRHHGSSVFFSFSAPLYVAPLYAAPRYYAPAPVVVYEQPVVRVAPPSLPDMPMLAYIPQQGQDPAQTTADRQACESIAWRSSQSRSGAATTRTTRTLQQVPGYVYPDNPLPAAAGGAALGALGGAIAGDAGTGAAIGAAVGAASWMLGAASAPARSVAQEVVVTEYVPVAGPDPQELRRTLTGCMQSRGYAVG